MGADEIQDMIERQYVEAVEQRKKVGHELEKAKWTGAIITLEEQMHNIRPGQDWPRWALKKAELRRRTAR